MGKRIELPKLPAGSAEEQMRAMYSYLYQMAQALNNNLAEIGGAELTDGEQAAMREVLASGAEGATSEAETLKSLIIKTASFIKTAIDQYNLKLTGSTEAEGKIGKYVRNTQMDVDVTPTGIQQSFSFQEIIQGLKQYEINAKNYIKSGLLRTVNGVPVYGVAIGKDIVTFSQDGTETYNDGNKVAELTAEELSFWQNGAKVAGYKGNGISFAQDVTIASGKKLIIDTENFKITSAGKVTVKGDGEFSGALKAASGTFAGTMSAACITSGTMSANRISGGTIDANNVTINNLSASKITSGTMSANRISGGSIDANDVTINNLNASKITSGTMSADKISGGTIDANNVTINNLNASKITSGTMSANKISGGTIDATNVAITNLNASNITSGTMSADKISGGTIDANNVTINNLSASKITSGTMSANRISGGSIDANNVTINNLNASKITSGSMSADRIIGGTLELGGDNNYYGELIIKDASGTQIGKWDKDGIEASNGRFSGTIDGATGSFLGTVKAGNWTLKDIGLINESSAAYALPFQLGTTSTEQANNSGIFFGQVTSGSTIFGEITEKIKMQSGGVTYKASVKKQLSVSNMKTALDITATADSARLWGFDRIYSNKLYANGTGGEAYITDGYIDTVHYRNLYQMSSRDIKHAILGMPQMGEKLDALRPVTFVYDDDEDEQKHYGLIYEETEKVLPEICTGSEENKAINYMELVPMLLKEIQELRARVSELERRMDNVQSD